MHNTIGDGALTNADSRETQHKLTRVVFIRHFSIKLARVEPRLVVFTRQPGRTYTRVSLYRCSIQNNVLLLFSGSYVFSMFLNFGHFQPRVIIKKRVYYAVKSHARVPPPGGFSLGPPIYKPIDLPKSKYSCYEPTQI